MNLEAFENVLYIIANGFRIFIMMRFAHLCLTLKKHNKWMEYAAYAGYWILNSICYLMFHNVYLNLLTNILPYFALTFFCSSRLRMRFFVVGSIYAISMVLDSILFAVSKVLNIDSVFITSGAAAVLMVFITVLLLEQSQKRKQQPELKLSHLLAVLTIPIGSILIGMFTMQANQFQTMPQFIVVESFILLLMNAMLFAVYDLISQTYRQNTDKLILEKQNQAYYHQLQIMEQSQNKVRFLRHDMKNHLMQIYSFAEKKQYQQIMDYINDACTSTVNTAVYVESGNTVIDSMLNLKLYEADEIGTEIHTEIKLPKELEINTFDINIIMGNLIDNSIAALRNVERKVLYVKIKYDAGALFVLIRNSCSNFKTENVSKYEHQGLGLKSVQTIIEKYNGDMQCCKEDDVYSTSLILFV